MRWFVLLLFLAFAVTVCVVTGIRVTSEGRAFGLGLTSAAAASVPASLLAFYMTRRSAESAPKAPPSYPRVVILPGVAPQQPLLPPDYPPLRQDMPAETARPRYRVVGEEAL